MHFTITGKTNVLQLLTFTSWNMVFWVIIPCHLVTLTITAILQLTFVLEAAGADGNVNGVGMGISFRVPLPS
jgi:hypothetical protein